MVKSNELRIGNIVTDEFGGERVIVSLNKKSIDFEYGITDMYDMCDPIQLSEEWLLKMGFEKTNGEFKKARFRIYQPVNYTGFLFCEGSLVLREIKYVNQLQNLYFALTGEELTYTSI